MSRVVDARGLLCPLPVLRLRKVLLSQPVGARVTLLATDAMAAASLALREGRSSVTLSRGRLGLLLWD